MEPLNPIEVRVLGSLIEKEITTPDTYPLTLNALTLACNQKSNRDPVMALDEKSVVRGLDGLREKKLALLVSMAGSRVPKYEHRARETLDLDDPQTAVLCELLLRGPQTTGELRNRAARMCEFTDIAQVDAVIAALAEREDGALVMRLPRQPGQKEPRYMHLLGGEPEIADVPAEAPMEPARLALHEEETRIAQLEEAVAALKGELAELREQFAQFRRQFE